MCEIKLRGGKKVDRALLAILACPVCKGELKYHKQQKELICPADRLAFPIKDGIPIMLEGEARKISLEEKEAL